MNVNTQQSNQFLNYQNYHHEQLAHHQYFDENPHAQSYNFVPYSASEAFATTPNEQVHHQENFPSIQSSELYEFLPEEIFQLDQPILKTESQPFANVNVATLSTHVDAHQLPFTSLNVDATSASHSFLDLSSGQIQTNAKYHQTVDNFSTEINNNSNYQSSVQVQSKDIAFNYQVNHEAPARLNCAVESEKVLKRKHIEMDPVVKQIPPTLHQQNYLHNQPLFSKRESSCLLQQTANYYPPELYAANFSSKPNDVYRSMEKYNNYITNN